MVYVSKQNPLKIPFSETLKQTPRQVFVLNDKKGLIGIEIEVPGQRLPTKVRGWNVKGEQSLRRGGLEYTYELPGNLKNVEEKVATLALAMEDAKKHHDAVIDLNDHTGSTHIHVNVMNEPWSTILGAIITFTALEPIFMKLAGPTRDGNHFCLASYDTGDLIYSWKNLLYNIMHNSFMNRNEISERGRYSALNIDSIGKFGSLEFRMFRPSLDPEQVYEWCKWCSGILTVAKEASDPAFFDICFALKTHPHNVYRKVFDVSKPLPEYLLKEISPIGLASAFELSLILKKHLEIK